MTHSNLPRRKILTGAGATVVLMLAACSQTPPPAPPAPPAPLATAPAAEAPPAPPAPQPPAQVEEPAAVRPTHHHVHHHAAAAGVTTAADEGPPPTAAPARVPMTVCTTCGVIAAITPVKTEGKGTALGAVAGGLAGLIVGNQIGGGRGRTVAKVAGAAGGAVLGNQVEKKVRATTRYEIRVRLDNGTDTTVTQDAEPQLAVGAAVRIADGSVVAR